MQKVSFFSRLGFSQTEKKLPPKKIAAVVFPALFLPLIAVISSNSNSDFGTLYQHHAKAQVATIDAVARDFGVLRQQQVE